MTALLVRRLHCPLREEGFCILKVEGFSTTKSRLSNLIENPSFRTFSVEKAKRYHGYLSPQ